MNARRRDLVHRLQPLDGNTCMAEELSESMEQWFVGIFYLLEAGEAAVARGTQDFFRLRRPRRKQGTYVPVDRRIVLSVTSDRYGDGQSGPESSPRG